jgi:hypothetical protein
MLPNGSDPCVLASVIGLVRLHNMRFEDQARGAGARYRFGEGI